MKYNMEERIKKTALHFCAVNAYNLWIGQNKTYQYYNFCPVESWTELCKYVCCTLRDYGMSTFLNADFSMDVDEVKYVIEHKSVVTEGIRVGLQNHAYDVLRELCGRIEVGDCLYGDANYDKRKRRDAHAATVIYTAIINEILVELKNTVFNYN